MTALRILIADDEPLARDDLRQQVEAMPDAEVVAVARDGREALEQLLQTSPDIAFLDVQMPQMDGTQVLAALEPEARPLAVFVTAYDRYAVKAFELNAVDYLVKPFDRDQFQRAFNRARDRFRSDAAPERYDGLLSPRGPLERVAVRRVRDAVVIELSEVVWLEAADNYVRLHQVTRSELTRRSLQELEERLDPQRFHRISRSAIVNLHHVRALEPIGHGDWRLTLSTGRRLRITRSYRDRVLAALGGVA